MLFFPFHARSQTYENASIAVRFSPNGGVAKQICKLLEAEPGNIFILASKFSNKLLEDCLIRIKQSGRDVRLVVDSKFANERPKGLSKLDKFGICVYSDDKHNTAHNKIIVAGNDLIISGSYNFNDDSENLNSENTLFIKSQNLHTIFSVEFYKHVKHSIYTFSSASHENRCSTE